MSLNGLRLIFLVLACFFAFFSANYVKGSQEVHSFKQELFIGPDMTSLSLPLKMNMFTMRFHDDVPFENVSLKFASDGDWKTLEYDESNEISSNSVFSQPLYVTPTDFIQITSTTPTLVTLYAYNIPDQGFLYAQAGISDAIGFKILSRDDWGADENLRIYVPKEPTESTFSGDDGDGKQTNICAPLEQKFPLEFRIHDEITDTHNGKDLTWPIYYSDKIQKVVVHHTASAPKDVNDDGFVNAEDYAIQVRGIYQFHTVTRRWGDIGYNFLIDPMGNIYEGRAGRQTKRMPVAAHILCQNTGTIGIALLGDFNQQSLVPLEQKRSLEKLIGHLSREYDFDPEKSSNFRGITLPNIIGHQDVGNITRQYIGTGGTSCPGTSLYASLAQVQKDVLQYLVADYDIEFDSFPTVVNLVPGTVNGQVELRFRNRGVKDLESAVLKMSNGSDVTVGNVKAGEWITARFILPASVKKLSERVTVSVYSKQGVVFKRVDRSNAFDLKREEGYVRITGPVQLVGDTGSFYAGENRQVVLRYPIETNANLSAGVFELQPLNGSSRGYFQKAYNVHDIRPGDASFDVSVPFTIDPDTRAGNNHRVRTKLSSDVIRIIGDRRGYSADALSLQVVQPPLNKNTLALHEPVQKLQVSKGVPVSLEFSVRPVGLDNDVIRSISDGDIALRLSTVGTGIALDDEDIPFALADDGSLVAHVVVQPTTAGKKGVFGSLVFGTKQLADFRGKTSGFQRTIIVTRTRPSAQNVLNNKTE